MAYGAALPQSAQHAGSGLGVKWGSLSWQVLRVDLNGWPSSKLEVKGRVVMADWQV